MKPINPLKGKTNKSWFFEQGIYDANGVIRAIKANGGTGNLPKVIEYDNNGGHSKDDTATLMRENGATMTKVIEVYEEEILRSEPFKGQEGQDSKARV